MPIALILLFGIFQGGAYAQESQPLEAKTSPFDFDNYRRTPLSMRQTSTAWASGDNSDLQRQLLSGERGKKQDISTRAAAYFADPQDIPIRQEPEPLPTPNQLTDQVTTAHHGETTKGQRDLLARSRVADRLDLSSMSEADYQLYASRFRAEQEPAPAASGEGLLRPMPTVMNSKTGGPPHAYAVSQAGVGARTEPRNSQNPFEDLIRALRLDKPVTRGTDPLPAPSARLTVAATAAPSTPSPSDSAEDPSATPSTTPSPSQP
jgi:hypothetical protein